MGLLIQYTPIGECRCAKERSRRMGKMGKDGDEWVVELQSGWTGGVTLERCNFVKGTW